MILKRIKLSLVLLCLVSNACSTLSTPGLVENPVGQTPEAPSPQTTLTFEDIPAATLETGTYRNTVLDHDFPDPDVLQVGDTMWTPGVYRALGFALLEWEEDTPLIRDHTREPMPAS